MPLSDPIETASGQILSSLVIPKGTILHSPIIFTNRNEKFWGPNAKSFVPERWLEEGPQAPKDIHGHRHLLTFSDGPKICLGRGFALAELEVCLSPSDSFLDLTQSHNRLFCPFSSETILSNL